MMTRDRPFDLSYFHLQIFAKNFYPKNSLSADMQINFVQLTIELNQNLN